MNCNNVLLPKKIERRDLFKHGAAIGFATLMINIVNVPLANFFVWIASLILGTDHKAAYNFLVENSLTSYSFNVFVTVFLFIVPFYITAKMLKYKISDIVPFNKSNLQLSFWAICLGLGFCYLGNYVSGIFSTISTNIFNLVPTQPDFPQVSNAGTIIFDIIGSAAVPALLEEFAFRGVVFGVLKKFGNGPAIIISSLLFACMHGNFIQIPFALCVGIGLGIARSVTGSIWPAVIIHFINNAFSTIIPNVPNALAFVFSISFLVLGIIAAVKLSKSGILKGILNKIPSCFSVPKRIGWIIVSPTIILSFLFFLIEASRYFVAA